MNSDLCMLSAVILLAFIAFGPEGRREIQFYFYFFTYAGLQQQARPSTQIMISQSCSPTKGKGVVGEMVAWRKFEISPKSLLVPESKDML